MKLYELKIDYTSNDAPVFAMSVVKEPAIELNFIKFNKQNKQTIKLADEEKQIIVGPALIPNKKIYRDNINGEEGYVTMSEDTVKDCAYLFLKHLKNNEVTIEHLQKNKKLFLMESWLVEDVANDKSNFYGFENIVKGTWFLSYKVDDNELWNDIKNGNLNGFSIEGNFVTNMLLSKHKNKYERLIEDLNNVLN